MAATQAEIEAAIQNIITSEAQSYSIGNRSVSKIDILTLLKAQKQQAALAESAARSGKRITVAKFRGPSR